MVTSQGYAAITTTGALTIDAGSVDFGNVINGGHLSITSSSSIDTGTITGSGFNVTLASGNDSNITVGAVGANNAAVGIVSMTPNGDGVISTSGDWFTNQTTLGAIHTKRRSIDYHINDNITLGTLLGTSNVTLTSGSGTITLGNIGTNSSEIGILALSSSAAVSAAGNWYSGNITVNAAITSTGALTIDAGSVDFGNVINGGHLNITSSSSIDTGTITGSGFNVTLASGNDSNITVGAVGASNAAVGNVSMTPNGTGVISTSGNWYANQTTLGATTLSGNLVITTSNDAVSIGHVKGAHNLTISAGSGNITLSSLGVEATKLANITLSTTGTKTASGTWHIDNAFSTGNLVLGGALTATTSNDNMSFGDITGNYDLSLTSGTGTITLANIGSTSADEGDLALSTSAAVSATGNWYLGNITGNAALTSTGALTIDAGSVDFGNVINGGHLSITSTSSIDTGTITGSGFNVTLASGNNNNITVGAVGADNAAVGTVSMTPNGTGVISTAGNWYANQTTLGAITPSGALSITTSNLPLA